MANVTIASDLLRLTVRPDLGAGIADFSVKGPLKWWYPLMRRSAHDETSPSLLGCFNMAPWANRIASAQFAFNAETIKLRPTSDDGSAMHGDVRARAFAILDRSPVSARFAFDSKAAANLNWPWSFQVISRYEIDGPTLIIALEVINTDSKPMPAGCGIHPYFMRELWAAGENPLLTAPVAAEYPLLKGVPTGPATPTDRSRALAAEAPLSTKAIDTVFGGFGGKATLRWPGSNVTLTMQASTNQQHLVLFTPTIPGTDKPLSFFALEPQSMANDGFNLAANGADNSGMVILQPGQRLFTETRLTVNIG